VIHILFPTELEAGPLTGSLSDVSGTSLGGRRGYEGALGVIKVAVFITGIGQVNTAQTMAAILEQRPDASFIMGGIAGAFIGAGLKVGDVAVATEEVYADLGAITPTGFIGLEDMGLPLAAPATGPVYGSFPLKSDFAFLAGAGGGLFDVKAGRFLTVSTVSGTSASGDTLWRRFGALCENMEGAAGAQVAAHYNASFVEVRGISNMVEDRDRSRWDIDAATKNCAVVIKKLVEAGTWS